MNPSCDYWHPHACLNYKSVSGCKLGDHCLFRHTEVVGHPSRKKKKGGEQGFVPLLKESFQVGCVSQDHPPKKSLQRKVRKLGSNRTLTFFEGHMAPHKKLGKKESIARCYAKLNLKSAIRVLQDWKEHRMKPCNKKDAPAEKHGLGKKSLEAQKTRVTASPPTKSPEERAFVVDSGASMHMLNKSDSSSEEMKTLRRSRTPTVVATANGEVQTNEEAQVYVHDCGLFVTVQFLEDMPAVLSPGKLCGDHGYSITWISGQKPRLTKQGKNIFSKTDHFVPLVVPGLSSSSGPSSSSTSTSQDLSSSGPAPERRDDPAAGNWSETNPITTNQNKKTTVCEIFLNGWRSAQTVYRTQYCLHPYTFLRTHIRKVLRKWHQNQGGTVFILTSQKTEIAKYA